MTVEEFNKKRKPFYLDSDTLKITFPTSKHMDCSHVEWFNDYKIPWCHSIRGYIWEEGNEKFAMIYWNDFEIPNITCIVCNYLFEALPDIKWIGMGCYKGTSGELWEPKLKMYRNDISSK